MAGAGEAGTEGLARVRTGDEVVVYIPRGAPHREKVEQVGYSWLRTSGGNRFRIADGAGDGGLRAGTVAEQEARLRRKAAVARLSGLGLQFRRKSGGQYPTGLIEEVCALIGQGGASTQEDGNG